MTHRKSLWLACACALPNITIADEANNWAEKLSFSGAMEVEGHYIDATDWDSSESYSDIVLATVQLGLDAALIENVSAHVVALYKQDEIDFSIHEGYFQFKNIADTQGLSAKLGRMYLPFGQLETNMVNDTLGMGLISPDQSVGFRQSAALIGWQTTNFGIDGYIFNGKGELNNNGKEVDTLSDFGLSSTLGSEDMNIGVDSLNNVVRSFVIPVAEGTSTDKLAAVAVHGKALLGNVNILAEYIQLDKLSDAGYNNTDQPTAAQIDAGYDFGNGWAAGLAWQGTNEAQSLGFPETKITAGVSTTIYDEALNVGLELWRDNDYGRNDGGTDDTINGLTLQFAASF